MIEHVIFGGISEIFLLVFVLMIFATFAGGNPSMVLKPLFEIVGQLLGVALQLFGTLLTALMKVGLSGLVSGLQTITSEMRSASSRHMKR